MPRHIEWQWPYDQGWQHKHTGRSIEDQKVHWHAGASQDADSAWWAQTAWPGCQDWHEIGTSSAAKESPGTHKDSLDETSKEDNDPYDQP